MAWRLLAALSWGGAAWSTYHVGRVYAMAYGAPGPRLAVVYAAAVLGILACHEAGHAWACAARGIRTRWPLAFPLPLGALHGLHLPIVGAIGVAGAWLPIRDPLVSRREGWAIAYAGVLTGAVATAICAVVGLALSSSAGVLERPVVVPGALSWVPASVAWHPLVSAAWTGVCLTAASLIPLPPFDGWRLLLGLPEAWHTRRRAVLALVLIGGLCLA